MKAINVSWKNIKRNFKTSPLDEFLDWNIARIDRTYDEVTQTGTYTFQAAGFAAPNFTDIYRYVTL